MMNGTPYQPPGHGGYMPMFLGGSVYPSPFAQHYQPCPPPVEARTLTSSDVELQIRQQPREALVTVAGKEKVRKPIDPPPIIQVRVKPNVDPQGHYMQSPYLVMIADLRHAEDDEVTPEKALSGTICSSLHRLKDVDNKDGAFFVFGDISVRLQGEHRLRFSLFDIHKPGNSYQFVTSIMSDKFQVVCAKDFHGMEESTYLSRAFSDQGVRIRLRKEPRHMIGHKRTSQSFDKSSGPPYPSQTPSQSYAQPAPQYQTTTHVNPPAPMYPTSCATSSYQPNYPPVNVPVDTVPSKRARLSNHEVSPHYSMGRIHSPPAALPAPTGNLPVQAPHNVYMGVDGWTANNVHYRGYYGYGRQNMAITGSSTDNFIDNDNENNVNHAIGSTSANVGSSTNSQIALPTSNPAPHMLPAPRPGSTSVGPGSSLPTAHTRDGREYFESCGRYANSGSFPYSNPW